MVAQPPRQLMTVEEWRELEQNSHDAKYEYIDGEVYLMSGGSRTAARFPLAALYKNAGVPEENDTNEGEV